MTDLVQKIAKDACRILGYSMVDSIVHEKLREAIRQALADAGGAVAWRFNVDGMWFTASKREYCHKAIADAGIEAEIEPLYTHPAPSADRVAELEAQLTESRELEGRWRNIAIAGLNLPYEQAKVQIDAALAAEQEKK